MHTQSCLNAFLVLSSGQVCFSILHHADILNVSKAGFSLVCAYDDSSQIKVKEKAAVYKVTFAKLLVVPGNIKIVNVL